MVGDERFHRLVLEEGADHADRFATVIEGGSEFGPPFPHLLGQPLDLRAGRHEHRDAALLLDDAAHLLVVEELLDPLRHHLHLGLERRIERGRLEHLGRLEVVAVEGGIDRGTEPDVPAPGALAEREAELELGGGLVDLVDHDGVALGDEVVLEPAAGDAGGDDDHVPGRRLGGGFAFPIHHPDEERLLQDRLGDGADAEGLADAGAGDDAEPFAARGEVEEVGAVLALQEGVELELKGEFDRLARRAGGGDDDHAPPDMAGGAKGVEIEGKLVVAGGEHVGN